MYLYIAYLLKYLKNPNFIPGRAPFESLGLYHHQNSLVRLFPRFEPRGFHLLRVTKLSIENWHEKELIIDGHIPRMMYILITYVWNLMYPSRTASTKKNLFMFGVFVGFFINLHFPLASWYWDYTQGTNQNSANVCRCKWPSTPTLPRIWEWDMVTVMVLPSKEFRTSDEFSSLEPPPSKING